MRERYIYVYRVSSINQGFSKKKKKSINQGIYRKGHMKAYKKPKKCPFGVGRNLFFWLTSHV